MRGDARIDEILVVTFTRTAAAELVRANPRPHPAGAAARCRRATSPPARTSGRSTRRRARGWRPRRAASTRADLDDPRLLPAHADRARVRERPPARAEPSREPDAPSRPRSTTSSAPAAGPATSGRAAGRVAGEQQRPRPGRPPLPRAQHPLRRGWRRTIRRGSRTAARAFAASRPSEACAVTMRSIKRAKTSCERLEHLHGVRAQFAADGDRRSCSPGSMRWCGARTVFEFILDPDAARRRARQGRRRAAAGAPRDARRRGDPARDRRRPAVRAAGRGTLRARKRAAGLLRLRRHAALVAEALRGPRGAALVATLRAPLPPRRHRRVPGHRSGAVADLPHDLPRQRRRATRSIVVGDPKQAIYGFRGADVATYWRRARRSTAPARRPRASSATSARRRPSSTPTTRSSIRRRPSRSSRRGIDLRRTRSPRRQAREPVDADASLLAVAPRDGRRRRRQLPMRARARTRSRTPSPTRSPSCWPGPTSPARARSSC